MRTCWAAWLGDCSDKISGEHLITNGAFLTDTVKVKGLPWCVDEFKTVGLASLVKNVLCTNHNSRLSEADAGAVQLRKALCDVADLSESRMRMPSQDWPLKKFTVSGFALERWCLKTLVTIAFGGKVPIGDGDSLPGAPPRALVETAFGLKQFQPPRTGLYWMGKGGDEINVSEGVVVTTFSNAANRLAGARFRFWGLELLLMVTDGPPGQFSFTSADGKQTIHPKTCYRPGAINMSVHGRPSHVLQFVWQERGAGAGG
jgi:hypothetical protein